MAVLVDPWIVDLRRLGAKDVDHYESKLRSFGTNDRKLSSYRSATSTGMSNVEFCPTRYAMHPISPKLATALGCGQLA